MNRSTFGYVHVSSPARTHASISRRGRNVKDSPHTSGLSGSPRSNVPRPWPHTHAGRFVLAGHSRTGATCTHRGSPSTAASIAAVSHGSIATSPSRISIPAAPGVPSCRHAAASARPLRPNGHSGSGAMARLK